MPKSQDDTSLGGAEQHFPDTTMGLVSRLRSGSPRDRRAAFETFCRRYWKPLYVYIRIAWAHSNEDAKDLLQEFFVWLMEGEGLNRYERERASLRTFLKVLLTGFLRNERRTTRRLKRGGGTTLISIDEDVAQVEGTLRDPSAVDPEKAFDRAWVLELSRQAIDRVRKRYLAQGREKQFRVYEAYDLDAAQERPTYAELASRLGMKESDVRNHLFAVREAVLQEIRADLAAMTGGEQELEEEWNALFGA